jgi:beta-phosphoglucomutase
VPAGHARPELTADALFVDFNGTLSDDEGILWEVYASLFLEAGRTLSEDEYRSEFAGRSDEEMFVKALGPGADADALTRERVRRYVERVADGSTVGPAARAAVELAAAHAPAGIVTSAWRAEVDAVVSAAGLDDALRIRVCAEDVTRLKPDPECYLLACRQAGVEPSRAIAIEDSEAGVAAAKRAGLRCAALTTTMPASRLGEADFLLARLDEAAVAAVLGL